LPAMSKIGRYMAMRMVPTMPPMNTIISGSSSDVRRRHRDVDLFFVEVGDLVEHGVERAGLLADGDHLHHHRGEHLVSPRGSAIVRALADPIVLCG
jgi:hypothetical protein